MAHCATKQVQRDPTDPNVPLAFVSEKNGREIRKKPENHCHYEKIVVAGTGLTWLVHYSFAGAVDFLRQALGDDKIQIDSENNTVTLTVPRGFLGSWKGTGCCVVGKLKQMLGVNYIRIVEESE